MHHIIQEYRYNNNITNKADKSWAYIKTDYLKKIIVDLQENISSQINNKNVYFYDDTKLNTDFAKPAKTGNNLTRPAAGAGVQNVILVNNNEPDKSLLYHLENLIKDKLNLQ